MFNWSRKNGNLQTISEHPTDQRRSVERRSGERLGTGDSGSSEQHLSPVSLHFQNEQSTNKLKHRKKGVKLPEHLFERQLGEIPIGESLWLTPWSCLYADPEGYLWLNPRYPVDINDVTNREKGPRGTQRMQVTRVEERAWHVNIVNGYEKETYKKSKKPAPEYYDPVLKYQD